MDQQDIIFPLALGIFSSLVATALFICISEIFRRLITPWIFDKIYTGVRIDGEWSSTAPKSKLNLIQRGDHISGVYSHGEPDDITVYKVTGKVKNMYFMGYIEPVSCKIIDAGSLLLHVEYNGSKLILCGGLLHKGAPGKVKAYEGLTFTQ